MVAAILGGRPRTTGRVHSRPWGGGRTVVPIRSCLCALRIRSCLCALRIPCGPAGGPTIRGCLCALRIRSGGSSDPQMLVCTAVSVRARGRAHNPQLLVCTADPQLLVCTVDSPGLRGPTWGAGSATGRPSLTDLEGVRGHHQNPLMFSFEKCGFGLGFQGGVQSADFTWPSF